MDGQTTRAVDKLIEKGLLDKFQRYNIGQVIREEYASDVERLQAEKEGLKGALQMLYEETKDYITINHLGDPHHNRSMQLARAALSATGEGKA